MTERESPPIPQWCVDTVDAFRGHDARSAERIAELSTRLAESGEILDADSGAADVASTGGPASLTTFVPPLILAANGTRVPKIGVPGRPAGVIDTLGVIPGYKTELSSIEFRSAIRTSNFGNTLSTGVFAPDDSILFGARQHLGAQTVPALVVASLLAKKLAAGLTRVVFDVRTMRGGNFGENGSQALANVALLQEAAALLGITALCIVTDGGAPSQPMVGRAEALRGLLSLLRGDASRWLERHFEVCVQLANLAGTRQDDGQIDRSRLRAVLDAHLKAQGADGLAAAEAYLERIERSHLSSLIHAPTAGRLSWNMNAVRAAIVANQVGTGRAQGLFPDACGVELLWETDAYVTIDTPIARVRGEDPDTLEHAMRDLFAAFDISARTGDGDDNRSQD